QVGSAEQEENLYYFYASILVVAQTRSGCDLSCDTCTSIQCHSHTMSLTSCTSKHLFPNSDTTFHPQQKRRRRVETVHRVDIRKTLRQGQNGNISHTYFTHRSRIASKARPFHLYRCLYTRTHSCPLFGDRAVRCADS
ncbi:unnamed protein product, partial [Ectocarpus sp. 6 AP-2014]